MLIPVNGGQQPGKEQLLAELVLFPVVVSLSARCISNPTMYRVITIGLVVGDAGTNG